MLANAIVCHILSVLVCSSHVSNPSLLASHLTLVYLSISKCFLFSIFSFLLLNVFLFSL